MLNPKLIEIYGKEAGDMLIKLVNEIGEDLARTCYIHKITCRYPINGIKLPTDMTTTSGCRDKVTDGVLSFTQKYSLPGEEYWMMVFDRDVREGDIQLWV